MNRTSGPRGIGHNPFKRLPCSPLSKRSPRDIKMLTLTADEIARELPEAIDQWRDTFGT